MWNESEKDLSVAVSLMGRGVVSVCYTHSFETPEASYLTVPKVKVVGLLDVINSNMVD
jgi:hypothetical protein